MAKILLSIYPEYTNAIFSGIKTAEFRRKVVNELLEGGSHTLYFYETKKNGGAGKVVGHADDYVSYRGYDEKRNYPPATGNNTDGEFCGCFKVKNGEIIPLDGDSYDDSEPVIATEEWTMPDEGIGEGLTVIVAMEFVPARELDGHLKTYRKEKEKKMLKAVDIKWDVTDDDIDESDDEACEILESLPTEMNIPEGMTDPDEISDWLSDETGFCHDGFRLVDQDGNDADLI